MAKTAHSMKHDITALKAGDFVLSAFPDLAILPAFTEYGNDKNDCYSRFVILYCAPDSPVRDMQLDDKKQECFRLAGVKDKDPRRHSIMSWDDEGVTAMANAYVRQTNWLEYGLVFHGIESAWQTIQGLSDPIKKGEMDEAKYQTAQKTRKDNLDAMLEQVPALVERRDALFLGDIELGKKALSLNTKATLTSENRARNRQFVPAR